MTNKNYEPTEAEMLASIVAGTGRTSYIGAAVQRSHRFPYLLFIQIENMAKVADAPVSAIINQLIACGLESVKKELPQNVVKQLTRTTGNPLERSLKSITVESKRKTLSPSKKPRGK
jgi:hypothetical protein